MGNKMTLIIGNDFFSNNISEKLLAIILCAHLFTYMTDLFRYVGKIFLYFSGINSLSTA